MRLCSCFAGRLFCEGESVTTGDCLPDGGMRFLCMGASVFYSAGGVSPVETGLSGGGSWFLYVLPVCAAAVFGRWIPVRFRFCPCRGYGGWDGLFPYICRVVSGGCEDDGNIG